MNLLPLLKRLWKQISIVRRKQLSLLLVLIMLASFAEVITIGAVIPFLTVLADPSLVFENQYAQPLIAFLDVERPEQLTFPLTAAFVMAAIVSGLIRIILLWAQARLGQAIGTDLSSNIYRRTLYQPYYVHVSRNSSEVIAAISTKIKQVVGGIVNPSLTILSGSILITFILITLISIAPDIALFAFSVFGLSYGFIITFTRKPLFRFSQRISTGANKIVKIVQEGLGGIRDILIDGTQEAYCKTYRAADVPMRRAQAISNVIAQTPKYFIETLSMILIAVISYRLAQTSGGLVGALPILGAFALGAQRLLPVLQQAYANYSIIRANQASLLDTLKLMEQEISPEFLLESNIPVAFDYSIEFRDVHYRYSDDGPWILNGLNISIPKGLSVGFIGVTGSGKSTFLDIAMGLLRPTKGSIFVDDELIGLQNYRGWQSKIAHVPQSVFLSDASIAENIAFGVRKDEIDMDRVRAAAKQAQIADLIESWDFQYDTWVGERGVRLSGGQCQRIGIARALYKQAEVLVFDEATSALDNETERAVMQAITSIDKNVTIFMVAHRLSTLRNCHIIVELEGGLIKRQGRYQDVIGQDDV